MTDIWLKNVHVRHFFVSSVVVALCLTKLWTVMEYKKALKIPFKVDKDNLVCMTFS